MKMKLFFSLIIFTFHIVVGCSQNELHIKKDSISFKDVPINKNNDQYYLEGFEVDSNGVYYFLTGSSNNAILTKHDGNKVLLKKRYTEFHPSRMYLVNDSIILFDYYYQENNLFILNKINGEVLYSKNKILTNRVNAFAYINNKIILEVFNDQPNIDMRTKTGYLEMDFSGNIMGAAAHDYGLLGGLKDLPFEIKNREWNTTWFIGEWQNRLLFYYVDFETSNNVFVLYDPNTKLKKTNILAESYFEKNFYDPWLELIKLRTEILYVVGHDEKNVIVQQIRMGDMFPSVEK